MKSSSALFPVALMRAEVLSSNYIEDTYLLKPNNSPDLTAQVALSRLGYSDQGKSTRGMPVILIHGMYSNRSCWLDDSFSGFAIKLLEEGYDPWMLEFRGHGDSPINAQYDKNSIEVYSEYDLPSVQKFIDEQTSMPAVWIGHGSGGVAIATAIAGNSIDPLQIKGVGLFNVQVSNFPITYYLPVVRFIKKILQGFKSISTDSRIGPEAEPKGMMKEKFRWSSLFSRWKSTKGLSYWKGLQSIDIPLIAFAGNKDSYNSVGSCKKLAKALSESPELVILSKSNGFSKDFRYMDTIKGDDSQKEVWPVLLKWIRSLN